MRRAALVVFGLGVALVASAGCSGLPDRKSTGSAGSSAAKATGSKGTGAKANGAGASETAKARPAPLPVVEAGGACELLTYEMIKDKDVSFRSEGRRLENSIQQELQRAQQRYAELMNKDHTYSTKEELRRDEAEVQQLAMQVQQLQAQGEEQLARLEARILQEISDELKSYLEEYNKTAGFDYIFSVQNGGQIWVGNEQLDITDDLVNGLNARYRASRSAKK